MGISKAYAHIFRVAPRVHSAIAAKATQSNLAARIFSRKLISRNTTNPQTWNIIQMGDYCRNCT